MAEHDTPEELAQRYVDICVRKWVERQLPVSLLASAMVAWGLTAATRGEGPDEVAAGLERIAETVRDLEREGGLDVLKH